MLYPIKITYIIIMIDRVLTIWPKNKLAVRVPVNCSNEVVEFPAL